MSIYSGFATRQQEQAYDGLLFDLLQVLQKRIVKFYTGQEADQHRFHSLVSTLHHHLARMEEHKYLEPKMSQALTDLLPVTATANSTYLELQQQFGNYLPKQEPGGLPREQAKLPSRDSLSFSRDQTSEDDFKGSWAVGRIKHQLQAPQRDQASSRGETNPEDGLQLDRKRVGRAASTHFSRGFRRRQVPKRPSECPSTGAQQQRKLQYVIREYVSRGVKVRPRKS